MLMIKISWNNARIFQIVAFFFSISEDNANNIVYAVLPWVLLMISLNNKIYFYIIIWKNNTNNEKQYVFFCTES